MHTYSGRLRSCRCLLHDGEIRTQRGLAVTPSKMMEMAQAGVPISSITAESFYDDGYRTLDFEPSLERQRGVDIGDLWEKQQDVKRKVRELKKSNPKASTDGE